MINLFRPIIYNTRLETTRLVAVISLTTSPRHAAMNCKKWRWGLCCEGQHSTCVQQSQNSMGFAWFSKRKTVMRCGKSFIWTIVSFAKPIWFSTI